MQFVLRVIKGGKERSEEEMTFLYKRRRSSLERGGCTNNCDNYINQIEKEQTKEVLEDYISSSL